MRKIPVLLMLLSVFVITSCNNIPVLNSEIQIRLENISDETLENLTLDGIEYGTLEPDEISDYQSFEYFHAQGDYIMSHCEAQIGNQDVTNSMIIFCGTGLESLEPGKYTIQVDYEVLEKGYSGLTLTLVE